jgi:hypothetical protein
MASDRKEYYARWVSAHQAELKEYRHRRYLRDKEKMRSQAMAWKLSHPERVSEWGRKRYLKHRKHILEASKKWKRNNPGKINAMSAKRRAALLQATPPWLNRSQWQAIESVYIEANRISRETGKPYHVDHVQPLQSNVVCGLHVPWNLQILPGHENLVKSSKLPFRK